MPGFRQRSPKAEARRHPKVERTNVGGMRGLPKWSIEISDTFYPALCNSCSTLIAYLDAFSTLNRLFLPTTARCLLRGMRLTVHCQSRDYTVGQYPLQRLEGTIVGAVAMCGGGFGCVRKHHCAKLQIAWQQPPPESNNAKGHKIQHNKTKNNTTQHSTTQEPGFHLVGLLYFGVPATRSNKYQHVAEDTNTCWHLPTRTNKCNCRRVGKCTTAGGPVTTAALCSFNWSWTGG